MKKNKLKKNTFIQGTLIASVSLILIKVLGALYVIPFYKIIGEEGGTLYSYAYNIYNLFLSVSTAGIPVAMSMIISEYLALNMYDAKERSYKVGKEMVTVLAIVTFSLVFFGSDIFAKFILSDVTGGHSIKEVSTVIKAIAPCLLIIPFLSIIRGYMQGHKFIAPTSYAQVIEQVVRILVVIFGSYVTIKILNKSVTLGVSVALTGAFFGGLISYIYLRLKVRNNKGAFPEPEEKDRIKNNAIAKKIITYCIPIVLISVIDSLYNIVDIKFIIKGLNLVGYTAMESEIISGVVATWAPKICALIISVSIALTTNIIPHVTTNFIKKDFEGVSYRINQAVSTMLVMSIPMSLMLFLLSSDVYYIFYGTSKYGTLVLKMSAISHLLLGLWSIANTSLQSMKKFNVIYKNSFIGLAINAALDIPLIMLFSKIGLPAYIATIISSCIGFFTSFMIAVNYLKREMKFSFSNTFNVLKRLITPVICIVVPITICRYFITYNQTMINSFISLALYGTFGMLVYLIFTYKNGVLGEVFGQENIDKILIKLNLKK